MRNIMFCVYKLINTNGISKLLDNSRTIKYAYTKDTQCKYVINEMIKKLKRAAKNAAKHQLEFFINRMNSQPVENQEESQ